MGSCHSCHVQPQNESRCSTRRCCCCYHCLVSLLCKLCCCCCCCKQGGEQERLLCKPPMKKIQTVPTTGYAVIKNTAEEPLLLSNHQITILDTEWTNTLQTYKKIRIRPAAVDCEELCEAVKRTLPNKTFGGEGWELDIVVTKKTSRVENDAEAAMDTLGISPGDRMKTVLFMFHRVRGSITKQNVYSVMYTCNMVRETFHIPYEEVAKD